MNVLFNHDEYRIPVKSWAVDSANRVNLEDGALEQVIHLANLPFAFHHVALMPDCHSGYGMPIGGVLATKGVVVPNAVGVDIGCGMIACKTSIADVSEDQLKAILDIVRKEVPVGMAHHGKNNCQYSNAPELFDTAPHIEIVQQLLDASMYQLGTLGGGNHFIEIQKGDDGHVWLMIHSGSRNVGYQIANYYNKLAVLLNETWCSSVPKEWELAFLPTNSQEGHDYIDAMNWALDFAKENRRVMMERLISAFVRITHGYPMEMINAHHNYASLENHFGENVYVHRKGAIRVRNGDLGIIPGSMGTPSYIVMGLGNTDSFQSASHGAGRVMGRNEFNKQYTVEQANKDMDGVVFGGWGKDRKGNIDLSESPKAYKDIDVVMDNQKDLVTPVVKLKPLAVMKG